MLCDRTRLPIAARAQCRQSYGMLTAAVPLTGGRHYNSEDFNTAGRTIKTGLIAVDVVSHVRGHLQVHLLAHAMHGVWPCWA